MGVINLKKGGTINLDKGLNYAIIGLGWIAEEKNGVNFDLDVSAFLLNDNHFISDDSDFVFYSAPEHPSGAVRHSGDDRKGNSGDSDCERLYIDFSKIPDYVKSIDVVITIYKWKTRRQNFGMVKNAYARLLSAANASDTVGHTELRFDLTELYSDYASLLALSLVREDRIWKFVARGDGYAAGLVSMINRYGGEAKGDE